MKLERKFVIAISAYAFCMAFVAIVVLFHQQASSPSTREFGATACGWISCDLFEEAEKFINRFKEETIKALTQQSLRMEQLCKEKEVQEVVEAGRKPDIAIITLSSGYNYEEVGPATAQNKKDYADLYGYGFLDESHSPHLARVQGWALQWQKIPAVLGRLREHEWLLWMDSDVVVMNFDVSIESRFPAVFPSEANTRGKARSAQQGVSEEMLGSDDIHLILSADDWGINTGVFLIRNHPWSFAFLEEVLAEERWAKLVYHEQTTMLHLMGKNPEHKSHILVDASLSSFGVIRRTSQGAKKFGRGDWLVHLTGACRYKAQCEKKVLPLVRLSALYREEGKWRKRHKKALLAASWLERQAKTGGRDQAKDNEAIASDIFC